MSPDLLKEKIESLWESLDADCMSSHQENLYQENRNLLDCVLQMLTQGDISVVCPQTWVVNTWIKKAILLMFRLNPFYEQEGKWRDKIPLLSLDAHLHKGIRLVPGAWVRAGVFLGASTIIMPSYINIGASIGSQTMVDMGAVIGSCAFVGTRCHIGAQATIGGVLDPLQARPVIIEDHCFVGANVQVLEGVHVEKDSVLGAGVCVGASTKILRRGSEEILYGRIPKGSVVVPGTYQDPDSTIAISCAIIVKTVDERTRQKTNPTEILRTLLIENE